MKDLTISVARDYTETPGGRYIKDGEFSGEEFRQKVLGPLFDEAIRNGVRLRVDLDGTAGYATSFLEETFGGLVREKRANVSSVLVIESSNTSRKREVESYIKDAERKVA